MKIFITKIVLTHCIRSYCGLSISNSASFSEKCTNRNRRIK